MADLDKGFAKKKLEDLISPQGKEIIKNELGLKRLSKKTLVRFFQGKLASSERVKFDTETVANFQMVFKRLSGHFENVV